MAEIAGLVIGGVGLATLTDTVIRTLRFIEAARDTAKEHGIAAMLLKFWSYRLEAWKKAFEDNGSQIGTLEQGDSAKEALEEIQKLLKSAEEVGRPYAPPSQDIMSSEPSEGSKGGKLRGFAHLRAKILTKKKDSSGSPDLTDKIVWPLIAKPKLQNITSDIAELVQQLEHLAEQLVPTAHARAYDEVGAKVQVFVSVEQDLDVRAAAAKLFPSHCSYQGNKQEFIDNKAGKNRKREGATR